MMSTTYDAFAPFYDTEYGAKDDDIEFYVSCCESFGDPVLEVGVGTGRVACILAEDGFQVYGIDNSQAMLDEAQRFSLSLDLQSRNQLHFSRQDMRDFTLAQTFNLVIIPFRTFLHNLTQDDQLKTLQCIHRHLNPNGVVALDMFVPIYSVIASSKWQERVDLDAELQNSDVSHIDIQVEHNTAQQRLDITNTYHRANDTVSATMQYRYIFRYEMEALFKLSGFQVMNVYSSFDYKPYDFDSGNMVFLARKI